MLVAGAAIDPFWLWQKSPIWHQQHGGHNRNLDVHTRFAKSLQFLTRDTQTVVLGSSRVYRGWDTEAMQHTLNLGISGLRIREMEGYANHLLRWKTPQTLIIGLDYFMFAKTPVVEAGYDPRMERAIYLPDALLSAFFGIDTLKAHKLALSTPQPEEGEWFFTGYKKTKNYSLKEAKLIEESIVKELVGIKASRAAYDAWARILQRVGAEKPMRTLIYLSPMHPVQHAALRKAKRTKAFNAWRTRVCDMAHEAGFMCLDATERQFGDEETLVTNGHSPHWIDISHFSPKAAKLLLAEMEALQAAKGIR